MSMIVRSSATTAHLRAFAVASEVVLRGCLRRVPSCVWRGLGTATVALHLPRWSSRYLVSACRCLAMACTPVRPPSAYHETPQKCYRLSVLQGFQVLNHRLRLAPPTSNDILQFINIE